MSLVFLKSQGDKQSSIGVGRHNPNEPFRFSNYLTQALRIPPNAQVAYISSQFTIANNGDMPNEPSYIVFANSNTSVFTNPTMLRFANNLVSQSGNWTSDLNNYVLSANEMGMDSDYTGQKYENTTINGILQLTANSGVQLVYDPTTDKPTLKTLFHLPIDQYNLYFNACRTNPDFNFSGIGGGTYPAGINWGTSTDAKFFSDITIRSLNSPSGNTSFLGGNNYGAVIGQVSDITNGRNQVYAGGANYYNTGYSAIALGNNGGVYNFQSNTPAFPPPSFEAGRYAMVMTTTGIKKTLGNFTPSVSVQQSNTGGHATQTGVAGEQTGGYALVSISNLNQSTANAHYTTASSGKEGFCGIAPFFSGVISQPWVRQKGYDEAIRQGVDEAQARDITTQYQYYNNLIDTNASTDPAEPKGACPRYFFGIDVFSSGQGGGAGDLFVQAKILDCINGSVENSQYINLGQQLSIKQLSQGTNTGFASPVVFSGSYNAGIQTYNTTAGRTTAMLFFRYRWINKTQMCIEYTLSSTGSSGTYENHSDSIFAPALPHGAPPFAPSAADPRKQWVLLASMDTSQHDFTSNKQYHIPSYMGDMSVIHIPVAYGTGTAGHRFLTKGWYNPRETNRFFRDNNNSGGVYPAPFEVGNQFNNPEGYGILQFDPNNPTDPDETSTTLINAGYDNATDKDLFDTDGLLDVDNTWLGVPFQTSTKTELYREMNGDKAFPLGEPKIEIGYVLGFNATTKNDDALELPAVSLIDRQLTASNDISIGSQAFSNHIQLTNLPIISQNGIVSSVNKTIYIVDSLCIDHQQDDSSYRYYCDKAPYPLWIDLNNLETIELNKLDVLITTDNNTPQKSLLGSTQLVIQFRDKTSGAIINSIPVRSTPITNTY
jgi:hypothetical protein